MKNNFLLLWATNMLIISSSCASLNENSAQKSSFKIEDDSLTQKLSKEDLAKAIKAKINSREFRIDMQSEIFHRGHGVRQHVPGYIQVSGDTLISCTSGDNQFPGVLPPKNYIENMKPVKYKMFDYEQTETPQGKIVVSFWYKLKYEGNDHHLLSTYKDRLVPMRYKLEFGNSTKVRIQQNKYFTSGTLLL